MGGTLLAIETSQSWDRPGEQGEDEEVVWSMSPSGPLDPCFIIFLYLERLFWNHIFTLSKQNRNKKTLKYILNGATIEATFLQSSYPALVVYFLTPLFHYDIETAWTVLDSVTLLRFITRVLSNRSALPFLWRQWSMCLTTTITA